MKIAVVGLGKIGLPLAVQYAMKGNDVIGIDVDVETIARVNEGQSPIKEEANLEYFLKQTVEQKNLKATNNYAEGISSSEVVVVTVPLMMNYNFDPDFRILDQAAEQIGLNIRPNTLVCLETTVPIGTTRNRFAQIIENCSQLKSGIDIHIVFSPERVYTGRIFEDLKKYPKIVGGLSDECLSKGVEFYSSVIDFVPRKDLVKVNGVWGVESCEAAEFIKLAETTYRDVNIALANQFAQHARDLKLSISEIIQGCNSQNFSYIHEPGISVGGHCIPVYPNLYLYSDKNASLVKSARLVNMNMPKMFINLLEKELESLKDKKILILGLSYREGVKETAYSGAFELKKEIESRGGIALCIDPLYNHKELESFGFHTNYSAEDIDGVILHTPHAQFKSLDFSIYSNSKIFIDGRNFLSEMKDQINSVYIA